MNEQVGLRGRTWFKALTGSDHPMPGDPGSVLVTMAGINGEDSLFLCVVPDAEGRFPCARDGQVGLEEALALAHRIRSVLEEDCDLPRDKKRPIVAIVDVKSQAYGRREETAGIFFAAAASSDAYASARMAGHPVIALVVGHAFSGGFLTHGYQANRILAFDDAGVVIHAMHKEAAARITRRSIAELDELGHEVTPMSYDVHDFAKLGLLHKLLHVSDPEHPTREEVVEVQHQIAEAIIDARSGETNLDTRRHSDAAKSSRKAGIAVRAALQLEWQKG